MYKINHNNHIQSLRGIAIISVILFHTNPEFFSTGYIGVDIFFVISGYLICKVLDKNEELNKNLLCDFYIKRARRTLPALLVLVFITIPFFIYILMPVNLIDYGQSLIVTPIFLSNFLFGSENTYWGALSELKPLLHTWSLSIEWQFYLLFPLLFFFKNKLIIFITLFLLSLFSNFFINFSELQIFISDHKIRIDNFFFTTNRIWEFLAGSCLYLFEKNKKFKIIKKNYLSILGLFLIFFSFYFLDRFARENIYFNLLPVAGSCLFIYYGNERNYFDKIYKNKFLLHIGLISYSLYLWHQPILAYFKNLFNNNIPSIYYYLIYFLIYIFSIASFYLIEKSFYEKQKLNNKKFVLFIFLSILIIIFAGFLIASGKVNIENSINKKVNDIQNKYPNLDIKDIAQKRGFQNHDFFNKKFSNNGKIKIYIYGDSHSRDLFLILRLSEKITKLYEFALDDFDGADAILYTRQFYEEMLKDFEKHDIFTKAKAEKKKNYYYWQNC